MHSHLQPRPDKPLLFLGIDGVLNPVCPPPDTGFAAHFLLGHVVLLSAEHAEWLAELAGPYRLVWCSTWEHEANTHIAPRLGLAPLPVVELSDGAPQEEYKWVPLLRHAAGRPFAWVDDAIPARPDRLSPPRRDRLLLPVDPGRGLRRAHVDRLLRLPPRARPLGRISPRRGSGTASCGSR